MVLVSYGAMVIRSMPTPSASAAVWASTVLAPPPISGALACTVKVASSSNTILALYWVVERSLMAQATPVPITLAGSRQELGRPARRRVFSKRSWQAVSAPCGLPSSGGPPRTYFSPARSKVLEAELPWGS